MDTWLIRSFVKWQADTASVCQLSTSSGDPTLFDDLEEA